MTFERGCMGCMEHLNPTSSLSPTLCFINVSPEPGPLGTHIPGWPQDYAEALFDLITKGTALPCKNAIPASRQLNLFCMWTVLPSMSNYSRVTNYHK